MASTITRAGNLQSSASNAAISKNPSTSSCCCPACAGLECLDRTRFFAGQLLTEADLNNEQQYWLAKSRLHNRYLIGSGVVCGMQVMCSSCDGWVTVKPGYAIDPCGNDIIVCADQPFNVIKAIQACCVAPKQSNCSPPRPAPPASCQDAIQKWCITIQYQEQPSRPVAPLQQPSSKNGNGCSCGCGGSAKGGCGCGGGSSSGARSSCGCSSTSTQTTTASTAACEPTRILETFQLGVCAMPQDTFQNASQAAGTLGSQVTTCIQALQKLLLQKPNFAQQQITDPNVAFSQACNFLVAVRKYLLSSSLTHCQLIDTINGLSITQPGQQGQNNYITLVQSQVDGIAALLFSTALDCLCMSLLPTCPPAPCDNCLMLACVTVQNGKIVDICHFGGGRKQVVTFQSLDYWLGALGLDSFITTLVNGFEKLCCGAGDERAGYLQSGYAAAENFSTGGITNPAMVNRFFAAMMTQKLGATVVNSGLPAANTVDLRPFVGQNVETVNRALESYKIQVNPVETGADWTPEVVAQGADFAPSAFPMGRQLTVFTQNQLVVGFEPTSPTDSLKLQVASLQAQVSALQSQINSAPQIKSKKS